LTNKGDHAWQRVFPALFVLFVLAGAVSLPRNVARRHRREYADAARLHLKKQNHSKIHRWQVPCSFSEAEMRPDKKRAAEHTFVWSGGLTQ